VAAEHSNLPATDAARAAARPPISRQVTAAVALGTLLNPLNSSMIAVAVVAVQRAFGVSVATSTWLLSGFYLTACVGQPLMGRIADRFGPRRVYCTGLAIVFGAGVLAVVAPDFRWVLACRIIQAAGTSAAYPAGLAMIRRLAGTPKPPAAALAAISVTNSSSAAFGPVLGGFLVAAAGWRAVFVVNIPLTVAGLILAVRWLPADRGHLASARVGTGQYPPRHAATEEYGPWAPAHRAPAGPLASLDLPGVGLFALTMLAIVGFLLSASTDPVWLLAVAVPVVGAGLFWRELRAPVPFLDIGMLSRHRALLAVLAQQIGVQFVFYSVFFGLPQWLERVQRLEPHAVGLLMLPIAVLGVSLTPLAARMVTRYGAGVPLVAGSAGLLLGSAVLLLLDEHSSLVTIVALSALIGLPNGLNNLGLQAALYASAPASHTGLAFGLFQTCRYLGAILATAVLGLLFAHDLTGGLHRIGYVTTAVAAVVMVAALRLRPR
jgi:MFS family permease